MNFGNSFRNQILPREWAYKMSSREMMCVGQALVRHKVLNGLGVFQEGLGLTKITKDHVIDQLMLEIG